MDSKTVFELRNEAKYLDGIHKLNKLTDTLQLAQRLFSAEPNDEWIQKALAYTLIDLCKYCITSENLNEAGIYFQELNSINFQIRDEIIEKQRSFLLPKIDSNYSEIHKSEELSKNGMHHDALAIIKNLISQNKLSQLHHEAYGWIIYRFIKAEVGGLSSIEVRTFLRDYMNLKNERPSMVHSMILNFALNYSKTNSDFKFYNFFLLWNPDNLRHEDLQNAYKDGKRIPSLISRIIRELVNSKSDFNIEELIIKIDLDREFVLNLFREVYFWNIFNAQKENKFSELWSLFEQYNSNFSEYGKSSWHSDILNLAERFMKEEDEWRFLHFLKKWNPENFRTEDWKETINDEHTYKPLATKAIKKTFDILSVKNAEQNLSWLIHPYEKAIKLFPEDKWILREKAILHFKNNEVEEAIKIYKQLVLELADKHYIWHEFAECIISDKSLKIGMLSIALDLEKNEDFLGDIHLDLAKVLIEENLFENALIELEAYKKHREMKGWKVSPIFDTLQQKTGLFKRTLKDNRELYKQYIPIAKRFAYSDFDWTEVVLVDKWKDDKGKERLTFTDGNRIEFVISTNRFEILKESDLGQIFKFKLLKQEIKKDVETRFSRLLNKVVEEYKYIPLIAESAVRKPWDILDDTFAVVDYINKEKNIIHAITTDNKEVFFLQGKNDLQIGNFVVAKSYIKKVKGDSKIEFRQIQKVEKEVVISKFETQIAVVDGVNEQRELFHFVINFRLQGIVRYNETNLRPNEGDFIKISFVTKYDKDRKLRVKILAIELTEEANPNLCKDIIGLLEMKYKNVNHDDKEDYDFNEELPDSAFDENGKFKLKTKQIPDYAFIEDYYVPKYLLEKLKITDNCRVNARAIYAGGKWKVIEVKLI